MEKGRWFVCGLDVILGYMWRRWKRPQNSLAQILWKQDDCEYDYVLRVRSKGTRTCVCMSVHVQVRVDESACRQIHGEAVGMGWRFMWGTTGRGADSCQVQWTSGCILICAYVCVSACRGHKQQSFHRMTSEKPQGHEFGQNKWKASRESEESVSFQRRPGDFCKTWLSSFRLDRV